MKHLLQEDVNLNKGSDYEAAKATIDFGFNTLNLSTICARASPQNIASLKIIEECGMHYIDNIVDKDGLIVKKYKIASADYKNKT